MPSCCLTALRSSGTRTTRSSKRAQHSLMFQEFVNRTGLEVPGLTWGNLKFGARRVIGIARRFPALFFVFVLGGEDPDRPCAAHQPPFRTRAAPPARANHANPCGPRKRGISRSRVINLRTNVPTLSTRQRHAIAMQAPFILAQMAAVMMRHPRHLVREYGIPKDVLAEAYGPTSPARDATRESLRKVRNLLTELGLVTGPAKRLWKAFGIWEEPDRLSSADHSRQHTP